MAEPGLSLESTLAKEDDNSSQSAEQAEQNRGTSSETAEKNDSVVITESKPRRRSLVLGESDAGCYLTFDAAQQKWVGIWSSSPIDDVVAYMRPQTKVPQFKYTKKEKTIFKSETARPGEASRDERRDFLQGLCLFVKLAKEFHGQFLLISKRDLDERHLRLYVLTTQREVKELDSVDVFYDAVPLTAVAVVISSPTTVYKGKLELTTFLSQASREGGLAVAFEK